MKLLVIYSALFASGYAALQGYTLPKPSGSGASVGVGIATRPGSGISIGSGKFPLGGGASVQGVTGSGLVSSTGITTGQGFAVGTGGVSQPGQGISAGSVVGTSNEFGLTGSIGETAVVCKDGEILHVDGTCVVPKVSRKVFVFDVPQQEIVTGVAPSIPPPRVDHNILFVRLPEEGLGPEPIIVPPPRQENIVYVLNKQGEQSQRVIEVPAPPQSEPEIYFVNYDEGDNPTLPGGVDLHTALGSAVEAGGEVIGTAVGSLGEAGQPGFGGEAGFGGINVGTGIQGAGVGVVGTGSVGNVGGAGGQGVSIGAVGTGAGFGGAGGQGVVVGTVGGNVGTGAGVGVGGGFQQVTQGTPSGLYTTP